MPELRNLLIIVVLVFFGFNWVGYHFVKLIVEPGEETMPTLRIRAAKLKHDRQNYDYESEERLIPLEPGKRTVKMIYLKHDGFMATYGTRESGQFKGLKAILVRKPARGFTTVTLDPKDKYSLDALTCSGFLWMFTRCTI